MQWTQVELPDTWVKLQAFHKQLIVLAPEVMCKQNHGIGVDYYAVGVIAFECMFGRVIIKGKTNKINVVRDLIMAEIGER